MNWRAACGPRSACLRPLGYCVEEEVTRCLYMYACIVNYKTGRKQLWYNLKELEKQGSLSEQADLFHIEQTIIKPSPPQLNVYIQITTCFGFIKPF
jgi:hypothetical protein